MIYDVYSYLQVLELLTKSDTALKEVISVNFVESDNGATLGAIDVKVINIESKLSIS